jgi:hypothetical protein
MSSNICPSREPPEREVWLVREGDKRILECFEDQLDAEEFCKEWRLDQEHHWNSYLWLHRVFPKPPSQFSKDTFKEE